MNRLKMLYKMITKSNSKRSIIAAVICLSIISFVIVYDVKILDPTYDDWLLAGGDITQHYIGWEAFRDSPWRFPFVFNTLTYPTDISIMFTDSIPLFAIFFKVLSPLLPDTFQYWGIFGLVSYMMMGIMAALILMKYTKSRLYILLGCEFFLLSPVVLMRLYGHEALGGGQWLILLALLSIVYYHEKFYKMWCGLTIWATVSFLSCYIHLYFALLCSFVLLGYCLYDFLNTKKIWRSFTFCVLYFGVLLVSVFSLGGFIGGDKTAGGYGFYSSNLNTFIDSNDTSTFLNDIPNWDLAQWEGYAYIGLGMVFLLVIVFVLTIKGNIKIYNIKKAIVFVFIAMTSFLYSLSNNITWNDQLLFTIPLPEKIINFLGIFRCTGRVSWVCFYILFLFAICMLSMYNGKNIVWNRNFKKIVLSFCLCIQILDLSTLLNKSYTVEYVNKLSQSECMMEIAKDAEIEHLNIVRTLNDDSYYDIAQFAVLYGKTVNRFNTVHGIGRTDENINAMEDIKNADEQTVYLLPNLDRAIFITYSLNAYDAGEYTVGIKNVLENIPALSVEELSTVKTWFDPSIGFTVTGGEDNLDEQVRTIYPEGASYGPYGYMASGTYHVTIEGDGLKQCLFVCTSDMGTVEWELEQLEVSDYKAEFFVTFNRPVDDVEFVITNIGNEDVELKQITYQLE